MVFQWKQGARIKADAQQAGVLCSRLEAEGRLTAKTLLDECRDENSPLHDEFEWNDGIAAEKYRENQARHIISCLVTVHESAAPTRSFSTLSTKRRSTDLSPQLCKMLTAEISFYRWHYANSMRSSGNSTHCRNWLRYLRPSKKFRKRGLHE